VVQGLQPVPHCASRRIAPDLAIAVATGGLDASLEGSAQQDALLSSIAAHRGSCSWTVDHASWVVTLHSPEEHGFYGKTLEDALAWCLMWLMAPEIDVGPFRV
jgi:hypothetical protein